MVDPWDQFPDAPQPALTAPHPGPAASPAAIPVAAAAGGADDPWSAFPDASPSPAPAMAATKKPSATPYPERTIGARVLGAPVDLVSAIMGAGGLPVGEKPFMGSAQVDDLVRSATGARETAEIDAARPGLTNKGGAPIGRRAYASFLNTPAARERYFSETYGPQGQGWYYLADRFGNPTERVVVRDQDGREHLFNPPGMDAGDVAGMAGGAPDLVGAIMGGAASVPAYAGGPAVGIPASAAASAVGAQLVGETVGRLFPENRAAEPSIGADVIPRAAGEATTDAIVGLIMGGAGRVTNAVGNAVRAPFARRAADPINAEFRSAADRLKEQGYDIKPLPSESGAGGFVPRMEGMLAQLPGSAEKMRQTRETGNQAIARFQSDLVGGVDPTVVGRDVVSELGTQRKNLIIDREEALSRADDAIAATEQALTGKQGPLMGAEAAGRQTRAGLERAREEFRAETGRLYEAARNAPGGRDPIVDIRPVREQVARIRDALPPARQEPAEGRAPPMSRFTPDGLASFLRGVDDTADRMTIDQARQMRTLVSDAIDDKTILPGVPERYLVQLAGSLSRSIDASVRNAGSPELRAALSNANRYYAQNIDKFSRVGVREAYREPIQSGYVEDNQLVARLLSGRGKPGVVREMRETMGANSPEWAATRRNAMEQIIDAGRDRTLYGRRVVDMNGLTARLNSLDDETVVELFGIADAQQLRNLAADIANRTRYLDADAMSDAGTPGILGQLRAAAAADQQIATEYRNGVIAPLLRGENGSAAKVRPEELVPWLYRKAAPNEARQVLDKLSPTMRRDVERGVVADIIESSIARGGNDIADVRRLVTGEASPSASDSIASILGAGRDTAGRQQAERIETLLPVESRQALRDLALITAQRQQRDATTQAVGGLAAGAAITGILSRPASAIQAAAISRGLAQAITSEPVRRWLTNTRQVRVSVPRQAQMVATAPALADVLLGALGENEDVQAAADWLREGGSQMDRLGKRVTRPPEGAGSWGEFFSRTGR